MIRIKSVKTYIIAIFAVLALVLVGCEGGVESDSVDAPKDEITTDIDNTTTVHTLEEQCEPIAVIPSYFGEDYTELSGNQPYFTAEEKLSTEPLKLFSELDPLGRCGAAYANICQEIMPTEKRGAIGQIKPSGWVQAKYPGLVNSSPPYLYNRCHLIAYQLAGENANEKNLITGTRYFNAEIMLPFENMVADYVKATNNHVLYRVTPVFTDDNLLCDGVQMEAWSVEDNGEGICFNV